MIEVIAIQKLCLFYKFLVVNGPQVTFFLLKFSCSILVYRNHFLVFTQMTLKASLESLQKEKDEAETKFEMQTSLLSENFTTIRTDLTTAEAKVEELTKVADQFRGEKLGGFQDLFPFPLFFILPFSEGIIRKCQC